MGAALLEDVLKVLDETDNLQKPNPPAPFPTREGGFQSLSPLRGEVWRGVCLYIKNFSNTLLGRQNTTSASGDCTICPNPLYLYNKQYRFSANENYLF